MGSLAADFNGDYQKSLNEHKQNISGFVDSQKQSIAQETKKIGKDPTGAQLDDFRKRLAEQKEKAKAEADKRIDQMFEKLETIGEKYPESQDIILSGTEKLTSFFSSLMGQVIDFVSDLAREIYEWVKDAIKTVESFFKDAYKTVSDFFGSLFLPLKNAILDSGVVLKQSAGDSSIIWHPKEMGEHTKLLEKFADFQKLTITVEDPEEYKRWKKKLFGPEIQQEDTVGNSDQDITLAVVASAVVAGLAALAGLVAYALWQGYQVRASISQNRVNFAFNPRP